jgi:hypothetical protein
VTPDLHGRGPVLPQLRAFAGVVAVGPHCVQLEAPERLARHLVAFRDDPGRWTSSS